MVHPDIYTGRRYARTLDLHPDENIGRVDGEWRCGNDGTADVHESMEQVAQERGRFLKSKNQGSALQTFISKVEQCDDTNERASQ